MKSSMKKSHLTFLGGLLFMQASVSAFGQSVDTSELLYRLDVLQQEVQALRGQVEQQAYTIEKLKRNSKERYVDLDKRLGLLIQGGQQTQQSSSPASTQSSTPAANSPATIENQNLVIRDSVTTQPPPLINNLPNEEPLPSALPNQLQSEQKAYQTAFGLVQQKKYQQALTAFQELIQNYPAGQLTANAYYWTGEVQLVLADLPKAQQAFTQVVDNYTSHRKHPDAMYKLAVVYDRMGNAVKAKELLQQVQTQYTGTTAANLAASYLQTL